MKVVTLNVNGVRSAYRKGFFTWLLTQQADVVCLQETRAQVHQLPEDIVRPEGYLGFFNNAVEKGYSGVALYSLRQPDAVTVELGWASADDEGRFLQADFGKLSIISLYLPSGSSSAGRQAVKYDFMDRIMPVLRQLRKNRRDYIICGDWNIAHKEIDLKNWRGNQKNSGFLPEERAWMDEVFGKTGLVDAFRVMNQQPGEYTWWSNRGQAWARNVGWRIDYQVITPGLREKLKAVSIYRDERFSDHAPLIIDYDVPF